jgi:hypothetical protein
MDLGKYREIVEMMSFQEDLNRIIYRVVLAMMSYMVEMMMIL